MFFRRLQFLEMTSGTSFRAACENLPLHFFALGTYLGIEYPPDSGIIQPFYAYT